MKLTRKHVIFKGRVQGVGFRYFCQMNAAELNLTGYAHNLNNGMVEIEVQGSEEKINMFIHNIKKGNFFIKVNNLSQKKIDLKPSEKKFVIR